MAETTKTNQDYMQDVCFAEMNPYMTGDDGSFRSKQWDA
jgi:hypothetical protein